MRKQIISCLFTVITLMSISAQSATERVTNMLNAEKWFDLREFYQAETDSIDPFIDDFARAMLAHYFNQHVEAADLCQKLLGSYNLDPRNVLSVSWLLCNNLNRIGENERIGEFIEAIDNSISPYYNQLDTTLVSQFKTLISTNKAKASYKFDQVEPFEGNIEVPFTLTPIGSEKRRSVIMDVEGKINGKPCTMVFDTGAGTNIISDSLAIALNLDIVEMDLVLSGVGEQTAKFAVAKELVLGDLKLSNVPFYVTTLKSGHDEADVHMNHMQIVIGRDIMEAVKFISFDFADNLITIMSESDIPQEAQTNMCIGSGEIYMLQCETFDGQKLYLTPDTGDSSVGKIFTHILPLIQGVAQVEPVEEKLRWGGAGGYAEIPYAELKDMPLTIEGSTTVLPSIPILLEEAPDYLDGFDGVIGIETFKLLGKVSFDLERMIMYPSSK